jgi:hypothetical protein
MQKAFSHRWAIEEYFKELKQKHNLENFRVREFKAIERIIKLILISNAIFTDSLVAHNDLLKPIKMIFKNIFNLKTEIKKKGIELLREIASKLANFGLINDFLLILRKNLVNSSFNSA